MKNRRNILFLTIPLIPIALAMILAAVFGGLFEAPQGYTPVSSSELPNGISIETEHPSYPVGTQEIKLIIKNESSTTFYYGSRYAIEKYNSGRDKWFQVPFVDNIAFDAVLWAVSPHEAGERIIYLNMFKRTLNAGRYRVWFPDDLCVTEFELTSGG